MASLMEVEHELRQNGETGDYRPCDPVTLRNREIYDPVLGRQIRVRIVLVGAQLLADGQVIPRCVAEAALYKDAYGALSWSSYRLDVATGLAQLLKAEV